VRPASLPRRGLGLGRSGRRFLYGLCGTLARHRVLDRLDRVRSLWISDLHSPGSKKRVLRASAFCAHRAIPLRPWRTDEPSGWPCRPSASCDVDRADDPLELEAGAPSDLGHDLGRVGLEDDEARLVTFPRCALAALSSLPESPRILEGDPNPPAKVEPRTVLLREGLDRTPAEPYFVHEEEVPRAGTRVFQAYQRTRWTDGRVVLWLGVRRQTGRGEGSSGLRFDELVDQPES
jgi:hypothetical protein